MPYKFGEYVSTYVDPQSVKISDTLRNRFMENFKANDQLAMAVDQMQAALPFENDVARKKELQKEIDQTLTTLSERGDYENLGFAVHKATKDFSKKYSPIKENYDRYQAAISDLDKRYKAKEIDAEVYARAGSYITRNYKGFEIDPTTGKAKEGTMFSAPTIYNDPNITDKMIKALSIVRADKYQNKSNRLAVGPDGAYTVTSESGVETVPPDDIQAAFDYVMADPNVAMAVQQKADMRAYDLQKSGNIPTAINQTITQYNDLINSYTAEMGKKSMSKAQKAQYQTAINSMKSEINKATAASKDETTAYNYIKSRIEQEIVAPTKNWAMLAAYKHTNSTTLYDYDPIYLKKVEQAMKDAESAMPIYAQTEAKAIEYGGTTVYEKNETIKQYENRIKEIDNEIGSGTLDAKKVEILNGEKRRAIGIINAQRYQVEQAYKKAGSGITMANLEGQDPTLVGVIKEMLPENASAADVYAKMNIILRNPGNQEYEDFVKRFNAKVQDNEGFQKHLDKYYPSSGAQSAGYSPVLGGSLVSTEGMTQEERDVYYGRKERSATDQVIATFETNFQTNQKTQEALNEMKVSTVFNYGTIQAGTPKESLALTKGLKEYFIGKPINSVDFPTAYDVSTGQKITDTDDLKNYTVQNFGYDQTTNTFELMLEDKSNTDAPFKKIHISGESLSSNLPIAQMLQNPTTQMAQVVMKEKPMTGTPDRPEIYARPIWIERQITDNVTGLTRTETVQGVMGIRSTGSGSPTVNFTDQNGNPIFEDNGEPSTKFRDINSEAVQTIVKTGRIKF